MRVLVTGSRELTDRNLVWDTLSILAPTTVVCGYDKESETPRGADQFAYEWALVRDEVKLECYPADWSRKCDQRCWHPPRFRNVGDVLVPYCPMAGHLRNAEMVESGADLCVAFFKVGAKNRGTKDCVRRAKGASIEVQPHWQR